MTTQKDKKAYISYPKPPNFKPEPEYEANHPWFGNRRCQAWSRSAGRQCNTQAVPNRDFCRYHGGKSPEGIAAPHFRVASNHRNRKSSRYLKGVRLDDYIAAYEDPDLLSLQDAIAQCDVEIAACNRRIDSQESATGWIAIRDIIPLMRKAVNAGDAVEFARLLAHMEGIVKGHIGSAMASKEKADWMQLRGNLSTKERQIRLETKKVVEKERVKVWIGALLSSFRTALEYHVDDQKVRIDVLSKTQRTAIESFGAYSISDNILDG